MSENPPTHTATSPCCSHRIAAFLDRYGVTTELLEAGHLTWPGMARTISQDGLVM